MRTRLDIMIHVDMDCDESLLGGVKAVTAHVVGHTHTRHVGTVTFECVGGACALYGAVPAES